MANYYDAHNAYVQQLKGTNAMLREYHNETLPALLQVSELYVLKHNAQFMDTMFKLLGRIFCNMRKQ